MTQTFENLDKLEKDIKDALESLKLENQRTMDRLRVMLTRVSAMRGGIVLETLEERDNSGC